MRLDGATGPWSNDGQPPPGYSPKSISGRSSVIGTSGLSPPFSDEKKHLTHPRKWRNMNLPVPPTCNCGRDILRLKRRPQGKADAVGRAVAGKDHPDGSFDWDGD